MSQGQPDSPNPNEDQRGPHSESSAPTPTQRADEIAADQYVNWQRGDRVRAEEYLRLNPQVAANVDAACDVVYGEFLLREDLGEAPQLAEYLDRFPELADGLRRLHGFERLNDVIILATDGDDDSQDTDTFTPLQKPVDNESAGESVLGILAAKFGAMPRVVLEVTETGGSGTASEAMIPRTFGLDGRHRLRGEIGRGGMGIVYRGRDSDLGRDLAIKVLRGRHCDRPEYVRRFIKEAQIGGQLQHPGIVPVYELGTFRDGRPYLAMKLVKGRTLSALLAARSDPAHRELPRFLKIFEQICQAIAYAHASGVVHRDLKPSNVMVGRFGEVQVMDWGLAKILSSSSGEATAADPPGQAPLVRDAGASETEAGRVMGTPHYMAPEQARGSAAESVDGQADVFSLGAILCEMLTGKPAYTGRSRNEIHEQAKIAALTDAQTRLNECAAAPELVTLALRCLAPEPDNRPRGAGAVAEAMSAYLIGVQERLKQAELAAVKSQLKAAEERKRRRLTVALAVAMLGVFGLACSGVYAYQREATRVGAAIIKTEQLRVEARAAWAQNLDVSRWTRAEDAASAMAGLLTFWLGSELRHRVQKLHGEVVKEAAADRDESVLLSELETVRADKMDPDFDADSMYRSVFEEHGLAVGAKLSTSARTLLVDGLSRRPTPIVAIVATHIDDWAFVKAMKGETQTSVRELVALAHDIDRNPWRNQLRDALWQPDVVDRKKQLERLASSTDMAGQPVESVTLIASAFHLAGDPQRAVDLLRSVRFLHPHDPWMHQELGTVLRDVTPPRNQEAIRAFLAATTLHPEMGLSLAITLHETGEPREAIVVLKDLIQQRPADVYYARLAAIQAELGDVSAAAKSNRQALELAEKNLARYPKNDAIRAFVYSLRGLVKHASGDLSGAVAELKKSILVDSKRSSTHDNLGIMLAKSKELNDAISEFREAIRLDAKDAAAYRNLGITLRTLEDHHGAIQPLREAVKLRPFHAETHYNLGTVLLNSGDPGGAIPEFQEAIRLNPRIAEYHLKLGLALSKAKKSSDALVAFREAIRIEPDNADAHGWFGLELRKLGQNAESVKALERANELGSKRPKWNHDKVAAEINLSRKLLELEKKLPSALAGREKVGNATEWDDLVSIALRKEWHTTAALLLKTAFAADPNLMDATRRLNRFTGILCAARSASGQSKNDAPGNEIPRTELRRLALGWLDAELADYTKTLNDGPPKARAEISGKLRELLSTPDVKGIRDDFELAKLPEPERASWRKLWDAADALLRRASVVK